jgi:hypothetical protein
MGSIISAIHDDMNDYERLCEKYSEKAKYSPDAYGNMLLDCYSDHARKLKERERKEWEQRQL